jgi:hypothetical protein
MSQFALNALKFEDVRSEIIKYLKDNSEYSAVFDFTASNMSMIVDSMAYISMLMSYQLSNTTNNFFLDTTTLRKNAVSIAKTMGYRPKRATSSKITGKIKYYDSTASFTDTDKIIIPAKTIFTATGGFQYNNFTNITLTVSPDDNRMLVADIELFEGMFKTFSYLGTGLPFQTFIIPAKNVEENVFFLYVKNNNDANSVKWEEVKQSFNLLSPLSYFVEEDISVEGHVKIAFGDGNISDYPANNQIVNIDYLETSGELANGLSLVSFNTSTLSASFPFDVSNFNDISTTTIASYGGSPYETLEVIKLSAPKSFSMAGRAVTKNDYNTLLSQNAYIYRSNVIGGDELFRGDASKLGNIFLTAIPLYVNTSDVLSSSEIYLTLAQEIAILSEFNKYRIISTKLAFMKPSYIYVTATPELEISTDLNDFETQKLINETTTALKDYIVSNYNQFNTSLRSSRLNSVIGGYDNVISSNINYEYNFIISKNSLYPTGDEDINIIFLPIKITEKDQYGYPSAITNFVKTNAEQKQLLSLGVNDFLPYNQRTIYGNIANTNIDRFIYNEDDSTENVETCKIKIGGVDKFFTVYRFESDNNSNIVGNQKEFIINNEDSPLVATMSVTGTYPYQKDNYTINIGADPEFAIIKRTFNKENGYKGFIRKEADITTVPSNGDFHEAIATFSVALSATNFTSVTKGEYIIYNSSLSGGIWTKTTDLGNISAEDDTELFKSIGNDVVYQISASGDFDGTLTETVSAGDYIIFNVNSTVNPSNKWEKLNYKFITYDALNGLDAGIDLPTAAIDYEIKIVTNVIGTTNFGGRSGNFADSDIIYYDPEESIDTNKWKLIINSFETSALSGIDADPVSGGSLEIFDYSVTGLPIGTSFKVVGIGDFGSSYDRVNWNNLNYIEAYENDVLLYIGNGKWNIYQPSYPLTFNIDGTVGNTLPVNLEYGNIFVIAASGDFNGILPEVYEIGDSIIYIGSNNWKKLISVGSLDASSASNLPVVANVGDVALVTEDGDFSLSTIISPTGDTFVRGDYIIFNGTNWTKMRDYTIEYVDINVELTGQDYINNIGFQSNFYYVYNTTTMLYEFYFDDIFNGTEIGTFRYQSLSTSLTELFEVGKMKFYSSVRGMYNLVETTDLVPLTSLFEDESDLNLIRILPKNKLDSSGNITNDTITDFDTSFNNFTFINVNDATVIK